jgi:hypothetical protein
MEWLSAAIQSQVHVAPPEIVSPATREQTIRWQRIPDVRAIEAWLGIAD